MSPRLYWSAVLAALGSCVAVSFHLGFLPLETALAGCVPVLVVAMWGHAGLFRSRPAALPSHPGFPVMRVDPPGMATAPTAPAQAAPANRAEAERLWVLAARVLGTDNHRG
jgi:hypothetical protein